jgi:hypothetical protein
VQISQGRGKSQLLLGGKDVDWLSIILDIMFLYFMQSAYEVEAIFIFLLVAKV